GVVGGDALESLRHPKPAVPVLSLSRILLQGAVALARQPIRLFRGLRCGSRRERQRQQCEEPQVPEHESFAKGNPCEHGLSGPASFPTARSSRESELATWRSDSAPRAASNRPPKFWKALRPKPGRRRGCRRAPWRRAAAADRFGPVDG